ncbi:carboxypeptidase regulatory-like domain-containing protein [Candidatus Sumerlaeota bacterium]|nr:carboxypeptidase regulatory-like domain-containing protein [Candidatus Sumerlaeota bacterium]
MRSHSKRPLRVLWGVALFLCLTAGVGLLVAQKDRSASELILEPSARQTAPPEAVSKEDDDSDKRAPGAAGVGFIPTGGEASAPSSRTLALADAPTTETSSDEDESAETEEFVAFLRWTTTREPAPNIPFLIYKGERPEGDYREGVSDKEGMVTVRYPADWRLVYPAVRKPNLRLKPRIIPLPAVALWKLDILQAFSAHGHVYTRDEEGEPQPVGGAVVLAAGKEQSERTVSEEDGSWRIDQIPENQVFLAASHGGLCSGGPEQDASRVVLLPLKDNGPYDLYLDRSALTLMGAVLRAEDLDPIPGAAVRIEELAAEATSDAEGQFLIEGLPEGVFTLSAQAESYADEEFRVTMTEGQDTTALFHMKPGGNIHVLALDRDGAPIERGQLFWDAPGVKNRGNSKTDAEGRVDIERVPTDATYSLHVWSNPHSSPRKTVQFPPGQTDVDVTVRFDFSMAEEDKPETRGYFMGTVTDERGSPIEGATVQFRQSWRTHSELVPGIRVKTDAQGRYSHDLRSARSGMNSHYDVSVYAETWGTQWKDSGPPGTMDKPTQLDFQLRPERTALGTVVDHQGNPLGGVEVLASPVEDPGYRIAGQPQAFTRDNGLFWIHALNSDTISLRLTKTGWKPIVDHRILTDQEAHIVMEPLTGAIRGQVVDSQTQEPIPDFSVRLGSDEIQKYFDENGRFRIEEVLEGQVYRLRIETIQYEPLETNVTAGSSESDEETVFAMRREQDLQGLVIDAATGAPVIGAQVVSGTPTGNMIVIRWDHLDQVGHSLQSPTSVQTDAEGRFSISDSGGQSLILVRSDEHAPIAIPPTMRSQYADPANPDALKIPVAQGATLTGSVVLNGQPQAGRTLSLLWYDTAHGLMHHFGSRSTDESGTASWSHVPACTAIVSTTQAVGQTTIPTCQKPVTLVDGDTKRVELGEYPGSATLFGSVLAGEGPGSSFVVSLHPVAESECGTLATFTDAQGAYRIPGVTPGTYSVSIQSLQSGNRETFTVMNDPLTIPAGEMQHDIHVQAQ